MMSMLDIVFILLIFFVVIVLFVKEIGIEINCFQVSIVIFREIVNIKIVIDVNDNIWLDKCKVDECSVKVLLEWMYIENFQGMLIIQVDCSLINDKLVWVMDVVCDVGISFILIVVEDQ